jgi:hypothetical protein
MFFLLFLLDDRRIWIPGRPKNIWILRIRIRNPQHYLCLLCRLSTCSLWAVAAVPAAGGVCPCLQPRVPAPPGLPAQSHPQALLQVGSREPRFVYVSRQGYLPFYIGTFLLLF